MAISRQRTVEECLFDLNGVLARGSAHTERLLTLDDLPRLLTHFAQWSALSHGDLVTPDEPSAPRIQSTQLLSAIALLEDRGGSIALYPRALRHAEIARLAEGLHLISPLLYDVWGWWDSTGRSFALAGEELGR